MNKKRVILKLAIPAGITLAVAVIILLLGIPYRASQYTQHKERFDEHITKLNNENVQFLAEVAERIATVAEADAQIALANSPAVREIENQFALEHGTSGQAKRYLWMSDRNGNLAFGTPAAIFDKLDFVYDNNNFKEKELFRDRNEFLNIAIGRQDKSIYSGETIIFLNQAEIEKWRDLKDDDFKDYLSGERYWRSYLRDRTHLLSAPIISNGVSKGRLFVKIDDSVNREVYYSKRSLENDDLFSVLEPLAGTFAVLSGLFLWFLLPAWVYIDAQQRDVTNPGPWAFITLISLIFGLAIYLITRPATTRSYHCPKCENELNGSRAFCPHCGYDLSSSYCPECQYPIKQDWAFCPSCRAGIEHSEEKKPLKTEEGQAEADVDAANG